MEGAAGNVLVPPLDDEDVAALLLDGVGDVVHPVAHVLDVHLLAGRFWSVDADHQHVGACGDARSAEGDPDPDPGAYLPLPPHLLGCSPP